MQIFFQGCDLNVFVSLALVLLHPCQLYPDGTAIFPPHEKNYTQSFFLSPILAVLPSFSLRGMGGKCFSPLHTVWVWTESFFWSCFRAPATSTLLFPWSCGGVRFFLVCTYGFSSPNRNLCAWNIDNEETGGRQYSSIFLSNNIPLTIFETKCEFTFLKDSLSQVLFQDSKLLFFLSLWHSGFLVALDARKNNSPAIRARTFRNPLSSICQFSVSWYCWRWCYRYCSFSLLHKKGLLRSP